MVFRLCANAKWCSTVKVTGKFDNMKTTLEITRLCHDIVIIILLCEIEKYRVYESY